MCTHVRARGRSRTVLANERKRKHTRTQINARKLIVAFHAWAISACKRDCILKLSGCTIHLVATPINYTSTYIHVCTCNDEDSPQRQYLSIIPLLFFLFVPRVCTLVLFIISVIMAVHKTLPVDPEYLLGCIYVLLNDANNNLKSKSLLVLGSTAGLSLSTHKGIKSVMLCKRFQCFLQLRMHCTFCSRTIFYSPRGSHRNMISKGYPLMLAI